jgi:RNA polymerase sigma-70 factor, ECF subfamily
MASAAAPALKRRAKGRVYDSSEELSLVRLAKTGDESAFTQLYHQHHHRLKMVIQRIVKDDDVAEWRTNIALTKVWENIRRFDEKSKFSTWVTRIAINEGLMHLRKQKNNGGYIESLDELIAPSDSQESRFGRRGSLSSNERLLSQRDLELEGIADRQVLAKAIRRVPVRFRVVLHLRFWEGNSVEEIRQILQAGRKKGDEVTIPYVKTLLFRGKHIMQEHIETLSKPRLTRVAVSA